MVGVCVLGRGWRIRYDMVMVGAWTWVGGGCTAFEVLEVMRLRVGGVAEGVT